MQTDVLDFLSVHMADVSSQWSVGTFGAIAEFMRDGNEPATLKHDRTGLSAVTPRGAIRIDHCSDMRPVGLEFSTGVGWSQRVALCLPVDDCAMNRRTVLTELGPDDAALREQDRGAILFDLGLDALQIDAAVRVADRAIVARLRELTGRSLFEPGNPAMTIIFDTNPHRVFIARMGRIEVFQPIPPADGKSPQGPHTHVLPKLLKLKRTHAATELIPQGWVPAAYLYPANPLTDADGRDRPFDRAHHEAFQDIMRAFGDAEWMGLKDRVSAAIASGQEPFEMSGRNRFARLCVRVAVAQMAASGVPAHSLAAWATAFGNARNAAAHP